MFTADMSRRTLMINTDYSPLDFIDEVAAVVLVWEGKAEPVSFWPGESIRSACDEFEVPAIIRLLSRVKRPHRPPRFTRRVLFNRDGWKCVYCGKKLTALDATVDHIVPRSHGGRTSWKNCVTSCKPCNKRKADRTPAEAGMRLGVVPKNPNPYHIWDRVHREDYHPDWEMYAACD